MNKDEALKLALEALDRCVATCFDRLSHDQVMGRPEHFVNQTITAIKEALAQPEREPVKMVAYNCTCGRTMKFESVHGVVAPQRTWVGLTEEDLKLLSAEWRIVYGAWMDDFARDIEAKLKAKNETN